MDVFTPLVGRVDETLERKFYKKIRNLNSPLDRLIGFLDSPGGEANVASRINFEVSNMLQDTVIFGGNVSSAAAIIFTAFNTRYAFRDSTFLIHPCIPPKGMERSGIFDRFDQEVWEFMSKRMKISNSDLAILAKKDQKISAEEALEIGLVEKVFNSSYVRHKEIFKRKGLVL